MNEYVASLGSNPYFGAGFGLAGVGIGLAVLRQGLQSASILLRRHFLKILEVPCHDKSYQWLLRWIAVKGARTSNHLSVVTSFEQMDSGRVITKYNFIPSVGTHYFRYGNSWVKVDRSREKSVDVHSGIPFETVKLTTIGTKTELLTKILEEARQMVLKESEGKTIMYTAYGSEWRPFGHPRKRRELPSVILDEGIKEKILADVVEFIQNPSWYSDRGVPYRRGYLLYGPPGCGKSSFITALAGELEYGISVLNLSDRGLTDDRFSHLLSCAPQSSIVLLEDVDAAFVSREESPEMKTAYQGLTRLTFSGFLNCLDGVASAEGRILFMTTNHVERLDPALIRPGRVDLKEYVGYCSEYQIKNMYQKFYQVDCDLSSKTFAKKVLEFNKPVSAAQLQGFFMIHKLDDLDALLNSLESIWKPTVGSRTSQESEPLAKPNPNKNV